MPATSEPAGSPNELASTPDEPATPSEPASAPRELKWVAHLDNLLEKGWVKKLGWSIVGLLVAEAPVCIALHKRFTAGHLLNEILYIANLEDTTAVVETRIDLSLAFYVVMGGFRVYQPGIPGSGTTVVPRLGVIAGMIQGRKQEGWSKCRPSASGTLTPHGFLFLVDKGVIALHSLPKPEVLKDRSKVDTLGKLLVTFQVVWMIIQVISRAASGLHVTLIELHAVLQTMYAAVTYIAWWYKPTDIGLATDIPLTEVQFKDLRTALELNPTNPFSRDYLLTKSDRHRDSRPVGTLDGELVTLHPGLGSLMYRQLCGHEGPDGHLVVWYFRIVSGAIFHIIRAKRNIWKKRMLICAVGSMYGAVHLAVWNYHFPSAFERGAWQVSSAITAIAVLGFILQVYGGNMLFNLRVRRAHDHANGLAWGRLAWRINMAFVGISFGVGLLFVLAARIFLLIESFIALRSLPRDAYQTVSWADTWPHIG